MDVNLVSKRYPILIILDYRFPFFNILMRCGEMCYRFWQASLDSVVFRSNWLATLSEINYPVNEMYHKPKGRQTTIDFTPIVSRVSPTVKGICSKLQIEELMNSWTVASVSVLHHDTISLLCWSDVGSTLSESRQTFSRHGLSKLTCRHSLSKLTWETLLKNLEHFMI